MKNFILFEQPVNEHVRACLRLEHLFQQAMHHIRGATTWDSRSTFIAIIDILSILDRPELKSKLTKELSRFVSNLSRLENTYKVDHEKLAAILYELEDSVDMLHSTHGKLGQELRNNDFINSIKQYLQGSTATCNCDTPGFQLWLHQPAAERIATLAHWLKLLEPAYAATNLLLKLIRQSSHETDQISQNGLFQATIDPQAPCQLVRVIIPNKIVYPVINVNRRGLHIRFLYLTTNNRPVQIPNDTEFKLTICIF